MLRVIYRNDLMFEKIIKLYLTKALRDYKPAGGLK